MERVQSVEIRLGLECDCWMLISATVIVCVIASCFLLLTIKCFCAVFVHVVIVSASMFVADSRNSVVT